jgi:hypothetical protein
MFSLRIFLVFIFTITIPVNFSFAQAPKSEINNTQEISAHENVPDQKLKKKSKKKSEKKLKKKSVSVSELGPVQKSNIQPTSFSLIPALSFIRVDGTDSNNTTGYIASGPSPSLQFIWAPLQWGRLGMDIGVMYQQAEFFKSDEKTLVSKDQILARYFIGGNYQLLEKLLANAQIGMNDEVFYQSLTATTIEVKKVNVYYARAGLQYDLGKYAHDISYAIGASYIIHLPYKQGLFDGDMGSGYTGSFLMRKDLKIFDLQGSLFYSYDQFPQKTVDFERKEVGYALGFSKTF